MKVATKEQMEALQRLSHSADGKLLKSFVEDALADSYASIALSDNAVRMHKIQGEMCTLLYIKKLLNPVSN